MAEQPDKSDPTKCPPVTPDPAVRASEDPMETIDKLACDAERTSMATLDGLNTIRVKLWEALNTLDGMLPDKVNTTTKVSAIRHITRSKLTGKAIGISSVVLTAVATWAVAMHSTKTTADPTPTPAARLEQARVFMVSGKHKEAAAAYALALESGADRVECLRNAADCYLSLERLDDAWDCASTLLHLRGGEGRGHTIRGIIHVRRKEYPQARFAFEQGWKHGDYAARLNLDVMDKNKW